MGCVIESSIESISNSRGISLEDARIAVIDSIIEHLANSSCEWRKPSQPDIPYDDPLCRTSYLYRTVPVNANLLEYIFEKDRNLEDYLDFVQTENGEVRICVFGGGPGTELLGLAKRITKRQLDDQIMLNFLLLDRVNEWIDSWQAIQREINSRFKDNIDRNRNFWPLTTLGNFCSIDITKTEHFGNWGAVFDQHIYIFSYILSEVFEDYLQLRDFIVKMVEHSPKGAKFLFIDRKQQCWKDEIIDLAKTAGLVLSEFKDTTSNMGILSPDENKTALGRIYFDVLKREPTKGHPRLTWSAFWVVGTKK